MAGKCAGGSPFGLRHGQRQQELPFMRNFLRLSSSARVLVLALSVAPSASAADYYVATTGSDSAAGTMAAPFKTVRKAAGVAGPGDTVFIRGGNYTEAVNLTTSGTPSAWITFSAYPNELPIFDGGGGGGTGFGSSTAQYIRVVGLVERNWGSSAFGNGWVNDVGTSNGNWQFVNCIADGNGINGITFYNASGLLIDESIAAHNGDVLPSWSSGVNLFHLSGDYTTNIVRRTVSFENIDISTTHSNPTGGATDGSGFILDQSSSGALFENNIGFRNGGSCIRINTPGAHIVNNTCYHDGQNSIDRTPPNPGEIYFSSGPQGAIMINNLMAASGYNGTMNAVVNGPTGASSVNNVAVNMNGATPFFNAPASADFTITPGSTNVIDKGSTTSAPSTDIGFDPKCIKQQQGSVSWWSYAIDYTYIASVGGVAGCFHPAVRPQGAGPDIGAYESGGQLADGGVAPPPSDGGSSAGSTSSGSASAGSSGSGSGAGSTSAGGGSTSGGGGASTSAGASASTGSRASASGGAGAGVSTSGGGGSPSSGCSCRVGGNSGTPGLTILVGLCLLLCRRRRVS
jgi:MYXO-CTERM domain-containing protein